MKKKILKVSSIMAVLFVLIMSQGFIQAQEDDEDIIIGIKNTDRERDMFPIESFNKMLYLIYGKNDFFSIIKAIPGFTKTIEEKAPKDFIWEVKLMKDEGHVPYKSDYEGLQFVFSDWKYPREKLKEASFQEVKAYYNQLSEKYGYNVVIPVMVLANLGNDMVRKNKVNEALEVLKYNVKLYPGEAHEKENTFPVIDKNPRKKI